MPVILTVSIVKLVNVILSNTVLLIVANIHELICNKFSPFMMLDWNNILSIDTLLHAAISNDLSATCEFENVTLDSMTSSLNWPAIKNEYEASLTLLSNSESLNMYWYCLVEPGGVTHPIKPELAPAGLSGIVEYMLST